MDSASAAKGFYKATKSKANPNNPYLPAKDSTSLEPQINNIPWLTKPKRFQTKETVVPQQEVVGDRKSTESSAPSTYPNPKQDTSHECPHCGRTGRNDMGLKHLLCDKCLKELMCPMHVCKKPGCVCKSFSPPPFESSINCPCCMGNCDVCNGVQLECPMHHAAGQAIGPHAAGSQMKCGCCMGTCHLC